MSHYEYDVLIGADGKRNTLEGFRRKEFRGKLAIAITANFINKRTEAEAKVSMGRIIIISNHLHTIRVWLVHLETAISVNNCCNFNCNVSILLAEQEHHHQLNEIFLSIAILIYT